MKNNRFMIAIGLIFGLFVSVLSIFVCCIAGKRRNGKVSLGIGIILGVVLISILMLFYGYSNTWKLWNVPVMSPCFADFRSIPGGLESQSLGDDPLVKNLVILGGAQ